MKALMVLFAVAVAAVFTAGLLGIAQQVADQIPTCGSSPATDCPTRQAP